MPRPRSSGPSYGHDCTKSGSIRIGAPAARPTPSRPVFSACATSHAFGGSAADFGRAMCHVHAGAAAVIPAPSCADTDPVRTSNSGSSSNFAPSAPTPARRPTLVPAGKRTRNPAAVGVFMVTVIDDHHPGPSQPLRDFFFAFFGDFRAEGGVADCFFLMGSNSYASRNQSVIGDSTWSRCRTWMRWARFTFDDSTTFLTSGDFTARPRKTTTS